MNIVFSIVLHDQVCLSYRARTFYKFIQSTYQAFAYIKFTDIFFDRVVALSPSLRVDLIEKKLLRLSKCGC